MARAAETTPIVRSLTSAEPSGEPSNDRIWVTYYPARTAGPRAPAVVLLHALGERRMRWMGRFARYLAARGIGAAALTLPYHRQRLPRGEHPARRFAGADAEQAAQALDQSASDVSTVITWLGEQPGVDAARIGVIGVSLGAVVAHLAMGRDDRLTAGVAILGGGDLEELRRHSLAFKLRGLSGRRLGPDEAARLREVDPIAWAGRNRPRRVLMVQAARDLLMPPRNARALWEALSRPPIRWLDTNHYAPGLAAPSLMRASASYLQSVWSGASPDDPALPPIHAYTLKLGMVSGLDAGLTPAVQWQAWSFARRRDHMALLHADLGWSGRGPFLGLALTLNAFVDVGVGRRVNGHTVRPYLSLHVVF